MSTTPSITGALNDTGDVNGTTLAFGRTGIGPPVVLIHGGGEDAIELVRPTVVGLSSGGVIALRLGAGCGERLRRVIVWEPPMAGLIPGGAELTAQLMQPSRDHLADHPGDVVGAQAILLTLLVGVPVAADDAAFAATRANAEAMVIDDPHITLAAVSAEELAGRDVVVAIGSEPNDVIDAAGAALAALEGVALQRVVGGHEAYLSEPSVLTGIVVRGGS